MKFKSTRFKTQKILKQIRENTSDLLKKNKEKLFEKKAAEATVQPVLIYDSNWQTCELVDIEGATTQELDLLLPQRATYNFSFDIDVPEEYLGFLDYKVMARTNPDQSIAGASPFTYSGLREVLLSLYDWQGVITISAGLGDHGGFTDIPISTPHVPLPSPTLTIPPPTECYEAEVRWSLVQAPLIGTGIGPFPVNASGTIVNPGTEEEQTLQEWTQGLSDVFSTDNTSIVFTASQSVNFKHETNNFPLPIDEELTFSLPCASEDPEEFSNETFPDQYWEQQGTSTFNDLINIHGYTYSEAVDLFETYYPQLFITPEEDGPPWKAFVVITRDVVETADKTIKTIRNSDAKFSVDVNGDFLLISPANTETEFSDEVFPTYKPDGEDIEARLKVFYFNPLNYHETKDYKKYGIL